MPSFNHSLIQARLINKLSRFEQYNVHSELTLSIDGKDYVPDIALYPKRQTDWFRDTIKMTEMPEMVIEVISPTQSINEIINKFEIYFESGIKSCWLVEPFPNIIVVCHSPKEKQSFSSGDVIDETLNIRFHLKDLFE